MARIAHLTLLLKPRLTSRLDATPMRHYPVCMTCFCANNSLRSLFAAILVAVFALAPALQGHAAATHPQHFNVQLPHADTDAQRADCCIDDDGTGHAMIVECGACVLPCISSLHSLFHDVTTMTFFMSASYYLAAGQIMGGRATAPGLRPPKARS